MMKNTVEIIAFSPTGGTKKVAELVAEGLQGTEAVVVAAPVYGGRIPAMAAKMIKELDGKGKTAVTLAVYGNRAYEDALLEINDLMEEQGFWVAASGACVAEHSLVRSIAAGRPDTVDKEELLEFGRKAAAKIKETEEKGLEKEKLFVPGNHPYKEMKTIPMVPEASENCINCGACAAVCPTGAISPEDASKVDTEKCISCSACVAACGQGARSLPEETRQRLAEKLAKTAGDRKKNEFFLHF